MHGISSPYPTPLFTFSPTTLSIALLTAEGEANEIEDDDTDSDTEPSFPPPPKIKSYKEAIIALEDVSHYLEALGHTREVMEIGTAIDKIVNLKLASLRQTEICDYFK